MPLTLVDEVVHLLGHDIGGVADPGEDAEVLEQWRDQLAVSGPFDDVGEDVGERRQRPLSGGRMSRMPGLVWNAGTAGQATGVAAPGIRR